MAEDRYARPVSGEIMAGADQPSREKLAAGDVVDAEFETVEARGLRGLDGDRSAQRESIGTAAPPMIGMDVLKSREPESGPQASVKGGPAFWIFGLAIAAGAFWVSGGHALLSQQPAAIKQTAPERSFRIEDVSSRVEDAGGRMVLFVDGKAVNSGTSPAVLPSVEIKVTAGSGRVTRYKLGTSPTELAPGARFSFSSRLEAPTDGVKSVTVDFSEIE